MKTLILTVLAASTAMAARAEKPSQPMTDASFVQALEAGQAQLTALREADHAEKLRRLYKRLNSLASQAQRNAIGYASENSFYAEVGEEAAKAAANKKCLDDPWLEPLAKVQEIVYELTQETDQLLIETEGLEHEAVAAASLGLAAARFKQEAADLGQLATMFFDGVVEHENDLGKACQADAALDIRRNAAHAKQQAKTLSRLSETIAVKVQRKP